MSSEKYYDAQKPQHFAAGQLAPGWQSESVLGAAAGSVKSRPISDESVVRRQPPIERSVSMLGDNLGVLFDEVVRLENRLESVLSPEVAGNKPDGNCIPPSPTSQLNVALEEAIRRIEITTERIRTIRNRVEL